MNSFNTYILYANTTHSVTRTVVISNMTLMSNGYPLQVDDDNEPGPQELTELPCVLVKRVVEFAILLLAEMLQHLGSCTLHM